MVHEALAKMLQTRDLTTWRGQNRWGVCVVVACLYPDTFIAEANGTPREVAFAQDFIDEALPYAVIGALYGYPPCGLSAAFRMPQIEDFIRESTELTPSRSCVRRSKAQVGEKGHCTYTLGLLGPGR